MRRCDGGGWVAEWVCVCERWGGGGRTQTLFRPRPCNESNEMRLFRMAIVRTHNTPHVVNTHMRSGRPNERGNSGKINTCAPWIKNGNSNACMRVWSGTRRETTHTHAAERPKYVGTCVGMTENAVCDVCASIPTTSDQISVCHAHTRTLLIP